jgi:hypothetical protein
MNRAVWINSMIKIEYSFHHFLDYEYDDCYVFFQNVL